jgi:hypothetical protein
MPSWKKVITSGSDASLSTLYVSNGITGSLLGTSSWAVSASNVNLIAGTNITINRGVNNSYEISSSAAGGSANTGSLLTTASFSDPNLIFTKGDGSTFNVDLTGLQMSNPIAAYYTLTASILSGTTLSLPNGLTYVSSSTYEFLEVHVNGLQLRYNIDYIPMSTASIQYLISIPTESELIFKSYKRP